MPEYLTVADRMKAMAEGIKHSLTDLLTKHSTIHHEPTKVVEPIEERMPWGGVRRRGGFVSVGSSWWNQLANEGIQVQAAALAGLRKFEAILRVLFKGQPQKVVAEFEENHQIVLDAIEQDSSPHGGSPNDVLYKARRALDNQVALVANLYDKCDGSTVFVPDTNALLFNPNLEEWSFEDVSSFCVVLLPTIVSELDALKVSHRNEQVRVKADGLITRIKGYRDRGKLTEGMPLRKGLSTLVAWANEPDMEETLPWLDASNNDDRFLAGFIEVMRKYPHSAVILVTRDLNLQNKAEMARVYFIEPPIPLAPSS
jgi:hypothetical protein